MIKFTKVLIVLLIVIIMLAINLFFFKSEERSIKEKREDIVAKYEAMTPQEWGTDVTGVARRIDTDEEIIALTLDACGGSNGSGYDSQLIKYLQAEEIPTTLFINSRWIDNNKEKFEKLVADDLFEIENHGTKHLPLSITGESVYGIKGTTSVEEVIDEVLINQQKLKELTGERSNYFRSGTAYYDEVAVEIVNELGEEVIAFDISGDGGAQFSKEEIKEAFLEARPGSIILAHMNQPESETAKGVMAAIDKLKEQGFEFVTVKEYENQLEFVE